MSLYLDTTGLVKMLVNEAGSLQMVAEAGRHVEHFTARVSYAEARAALGKARRMGRLTASEQTQCLHDLDGWWPALQRVAITEELVHRAGDLAMRFGLRGYDAVHLSAALQVAHLDTLLFAAWDADLRTAARAAGLTVFPP